MDVKLELDKMRAVFAQKYNDIHRGMGKADQAAKAIMLRWVEGGKNIFVLWGPPGSGKSTLMNSIVASNSHGIDEDTMVFETTGLNRSINKFLLSLPRSQVRFLRCAAPNHVCIQRVLNRKSNPLCGIEGDDPEYLVKLISAWFDKASHALPEE